LANPEPSTPPSRINARALQAANERERCALDHTAEEWREPQAGRRGTLQLDLFDERNLIAFTHE
jgi:hypothetical protein